MEALVQFTYVIASNNDTKSVTVKLNVVDFDGMIEILKHKSKPFYITKERYAVNADPDLKFQVMIKSDCRCNLEIYYLAPRPAFIKAYCYMLDRNGRRNHATTKRHDRSSVCEWQLLAVIPKQDMSNSTSVIQSQPQALNYTNQQSYIQAAHVVQASLPRCLRFEYVFSVDKTMETDDIKKVCKIDLSNDLAVLLKNSTLSDIIIKSMEGIEYPAHKAILIARSQVLKAHFLHNTKESQTNIIESDFEAEVLREVLDYIYMDVPPAKINDMPDKLLAAADFYHLEGLKVLCGKALLRQLSVQNALKTLALADLYSMLNLKSLTLKFINDGNFKEIIKTKDWENLKSVELIKNICEDKYV